ncbi:hypothetical protein RQN30_06690 [Arcanobacterium hippocoleae]
MKVRKTIAAISAFTLAAMGMTACSNILDPTAEGAITVYSNSISDGRGDWLKEQAKKPGLS